MKFIIQASREMLESNAGLVLAGKILSGLDLDRRADFFGVRLGSTVCRRRRHCGSVCHE